jgi:predicted flap endonuclease-1-like 5' DNA nuclease
MKIEEIEGIGPAYGAKLSAAGVTTTEGLLERGATRKGRAELETATGITGTLILEWVNHADLMRVKGVGSEYSDLLEAAGIDSPAELAQRNAANLAKAIADANEKKKLVRQVPSESVVAGWIAEAKEMKKVVEH